METLGALLETLPRLFGWPDLAALAALVACTTATSLLIERAGARRPSVSRLMELHRAAWMEELARRDVRIMDAQLLATLRAGAAFFGSTCLIAIGGVAALIGQAEELVMLGRDIGAVEGAEIRPVWEAKLIVVLLLLVNAFLKFVWSHRLFGYCAVLMGAMPAPGEAGIEASVARATELHRSAARSFNRGLRTIYFTLAALAWFLGPIALVLASLATAAMLYRREFLSRSRRALMAD
jgi:uncharacterized membrane protein